MVDRAVRIAIAKRRVTALVFPNDLQEESCADPPRKHGTTHTGVGYGKPCSEFLPKEGSVPLNTAKEALSSILPGRKL